jgi:uncharacterized membrane protein
MLVTLLAFHLLAAIFWVGGMAFAYFILRPATGPMQPADRFALWHGVFRRFLPWVGLSIVVLLATGYGMLAPYFGGFADAPLYVNLMQALGIVMMLLYLHLVFAPWRRFQAAVAAAAPAEAAKQLGQIRILVAINLGLGILTVLAGGTGRFW